MKRLQVGDECYVRGDISGDIYQCEYVGKMYGYNHVALPKNKKMRLRFFNIGKGSNTKLVYPFPCIKELAI